MEGGDVAAIAAGGAAWNVASLSSVAAPLLPAVERSHTAAEPALQPPHPPCLKSISLIWEQIISRNLFH